MITVNVTSGSQVEGMRLSDELASEVFGPQATDIAKVSGMNRFVLQQLAIYLAFVKGWTISNAEAYVADRVEVIS